MEVRPDIAQQSLRISDNAGGVVKAKLSVLVAPGQTTTAPNAHAIGIFGVGSKRAVVALAQDISITTRPRTGNTTFRIEIDDEWINDDDNWDLPHFAVDPIAKGSTVIDLSRLRMHIDEGTIGALSTHLSEVYASFLGTPGFGIKVGPAEVGPTVFSNWAYPPSYEPRHHSGTIATPEGDAISVDVRVGLMRESNAEGNWGVSVYCNDRLIIKDYKDPSLGFVSGRVGKPHPDLSLLRAEVRLAGPVRAMPWNSTKSDVNREHPVYGVLATWLEPVLKDWASLSRRTSGEWRTAVFPFREGEFAERPAENFASPGRSHLPPLPVANVPYADRLEERNRTLAERKPWIAGLYETIAVVDYVSRRSYKQKNRIQLILLDSTLEIAMKEYLAYESGANYSDTRLKQLFDSRAQLKTEVEQHAHLGAATWQAIDYFHTARNKLIHEKAAAAVSDEDIARFRRLVQSVLRTLLGVRLGQ